MRKLLFILALLAAGPIALSAFTSPAFADKIVCPKTDTSESHLNKLRSECYATVHCSAFHDLLRM